MFWGVRRNQNENWIELIIPQWMTQRLTILNLERLWRCRIQEACEMTQKLNL